MKKVYLIFAALTSVALFSCTGDELAENAPVTNPEVEKPIMFSSLNKGMTRADYKGKDAATLLGNKFVVTGYKGPKSLWSANSIITMDNYFVEYTENTAHTTESNVANWEYVGKPRTQHAINKGITSQTIKYWDYSADQYDFIAWSTGSKTAIYEEPATGVPSGSVYVSAITPETATGTGTGKVAYIFKGAAKDLQECYISDLVTVKKAQYGDNPVTMKFRSLGSKVRIGIYETVPGYSVKDVKFYTAADVALAGDDTDNTPRIFSTAANNIFKNGTYTITFPTVDAPSDADNNQAHVSFAGDGTQSTIVEFGALDYTTAEEGEKTAGKKFLGRTSATASYAGEAEGNYYTQYLPNEAGTNLNLRVNFTLESIDGGGEVIYVKGATAQIPSIYTQWKAGYAYTYIFKISDKTNGYTGEYDPLFPDDTSVNSDPAGLYPITFDAVVVNAEDNDKTQETITTVSTPSITTYQKGSTVINNNEYLAATGDIFVTVNDGNEETTPDLANGALQDLTGKAAIYTLPTYTTKVYTEADVVDALQIQDDDAATGTIKGRSGLELTEQTLTLTNTIEYGVDGNTIEIPVDGTKKKAARFTPSVGTYAFVYTKKAPTAAGNIDRYEEVTKAAGDDVTNLYRNFNLTAITGDAFGGQVYMEFNTTTGVLTTKTMFTGQDVSNLYLNDTGTTYAAGSASTGTTYYYSDGGIFKAAANIAYADFATATDLYTYDGVSSYTLKTDATPVDGTAYYQKTTSGGIDTYTYCVILPQQVDGLYLYQFNAAGRYACFANEQALAGHGYFDKYTQNNGVYYTKVIKVQ